MSPVDDFVAKWMIKANNDLTIARDERDVLRTAKMTDGICFHCQQCVEKMLKAFLTHHNIEFHKVHNLEYLVQLCAAIDPELSSLDTGNLSGYGVLIRYPDNFYMPTLEEADEAIRIAVKVRDTIASKLNRTIPRIDS